MTELRKKGMAAATKKASRHAAEGLVGLARGDGPVAAVVEVRERARRRRRGGQAAAGSSAHLPVTHTHTTTTTTMPPCPRRRSTARPTLWPATSSLGRWSAAPRRRRSPSPPRPVAAAAAAEEAAAARDVRWGMPTSGRRAWPMAARELRGGGGGPHCVLESVGEWAALYNNNNNNYSLYLNQQADF